MKLSIIITKKKLSGTILIFTLTVLGILFILTTAALNLVRYDQHLANQSYRVNQARQIAEAGVDLAIRRLNDDSNYVGETDILLGDGTLTITISGSGSNRTIEAYGYIPNSTNPTAKRKIIVDANIDNTEAEFFYGLQVGDGGLTMGNTSGIVGNVYSNGSIIGSNGAYITGDVIVAGRLNDNPSLEWTTENADQLFATIDDNRDIAQSFSAPVSDKLYKIAVNLGKVGSPTTGINVRITEDDGNNTPKRNAIASGVISASTVGNTPSWIDATFSAPPTLVAGTKYWLVLDTGSSSGTDHWNWRSDNTDDYANNTSMYTSSWSFNNANWTGTNSDLGFKIWMGGVATKIESMIIGDATTGTGYANSFVSMTIHGSDCPNVYCIISNPSPATLPISDGLIDDWQADATAGGTIDDDYTVSANTSLGPKKITGDLIMTSNNVSLTVTGTLYVQGNIDVSNGSAIKCDPGYGVSSCLVLADGWVHTTNNGSFSGSGTAGSYIMMLTTLACPGTGATDPGGKPCGHHDSAIDVHNQAAGVIFYAGKGKINLHQGVAITEATAYKINVENTAIITYESGLANVLFSGGPGGGWVVKRTTWREVRIF